MEFYQVVQERRSIRSYLPTKVADDKLVRVLTAGQLAPSGKNAQAWKFIVSREAELKAALVGACKGQKFIAEADIVLTVCVDQTACYQDHGAYMTSFAVDGAIAMQQMMLAAVVEELGTCWIGAFSEEGVRELLNVPEPYRIIGLTPLGYPANAGKDRGRKELAQLIKWEKW